MLLAELGASLLLGLVETWLSGFFGVLKNVVQPSRFELGPLDELVDPSAELLVVMIGKGMLEAVWPDSAGTESSLSFVRSFPFERNGDGFRWTGVSSDSILRFDDRDTMSSASFSCCSFASKVCLLLRTSCDSEASLSSSSGLIFRTLTGLKMSVISSNKHCSTPSVTTLSMNVPIATWRSVRILSDYL
jgi:hypothetical protein